MEVLSSQNKLFIFIFVFVFVVLELCLFVNATMIASSTSHLQRLCPDHERSALLQFELSFSIYCAADSDAYPRTESWEHENCCSWDGVKCDEETGHVIGLDLSNSCLYGSFPSNSTLFSLSHLQELNLAFNLFNGSRIPSEIGQLNNLKSLNLSQSEFIGQIPLEISNLWKLSLLDLSWNNKISDTGQVHLNVEHPSLEKLVRNFTRLKHLYLDRIDISSPVPTILANLTTLETISVTFSKLYGQFPASIFGLPHLHTLYLSGNGALTGFLPEFKENSPLRILSLYNTGFSGPLPSSIGELVHMEFINFGYCSFSGFIPSSFGNLTKLTTLILVGNILGGSLPSSLLNLTQLQTLDLSNLNVKPDMLFVWLFKLKNLNTLDLSGMNIGGEIHHHIANLTALTELDLGENQLTGQMPHWLMNLTQLNSLLLNNNHLIGPIPPEISQLRNLQDIKLSYNNLHGNFDAFSKLSNLNWVELSGINITFSPIANITNDTVPNLSSLELSSCNLTVFPTFLKSQKFLEVLILSDNNIHGMIPQWFVNTTAESLYKLDLSNNFLTGFELPGLTLPWSFLEVCYLQQNMLQGLVPVPWNSMVIYQVSDNQLTGSLPQQLCEATSLNYLDLSNNKLGGLIPDCISQLSGSLYVMNLRGNNFRGTIPQAYPKSCMLKMINLSQNNLQGRLPRSLANCTMLEVFDIGENRIVDTFPSWMGSLHNLQILVLGRNNFHGSIGKPKSTSDFQSLHIIDLSHNFYSGELPYHYFQNWVAMKITMENQTNVSSTVYHFVVSMPDVPLLIDKVYNYSITITNKGNQMLFSKILTVLRVIDLSNNNFTGRIPSSIGELKGLQALNLSNNNLNGNIPRSLADIKGLESLDLSNNVLEGEIPQKLSDLTFLEVFNVSHNLLKGPIPQGNQFNVFDNSSFTGNLGLCGSLLSKKCGDEDEAPEPPKLTVEEEEDNSSKIDWIIRALGCVSGFLVGCFIAKHITDQNHQWFVGTFAGKRRPRTRKDTV